MPTASSWLSTHRNEALAAGAGGIVLLALFRRSSAASSAAGSGPSAAAAPSSGYDSTGIDQYNSLASAISQQNDAIDTLEGQVAAALNSGHGNGQGGSTPVQHPGRHGKTPKKKPAKKPAHAKRPRIDPGGPEKRPPARVTPLRPVRPIGRVPAPVHPPAAPRRKA